MYYRFQSSFLFSIAIIIAIIIITSIIIVSPSCTDFFVQCQVPLPLTPRPQLTKVMYNCTRATKLIQISGDQGFGVELVLDVTEFCSIDIQNATFDKLTIVPHSKQTQTSLVLSSFVIKNVYCRNSFPNVPTIVNFCINSTANVVIEKTVEIRNVTRQSFLVDDDDEYSLSHSSTFGVVHISNLGMHAPYAASGHIRPIFSQIRMGDVHLLVKGEVISSLLGFYLVYFEGPTYIAFLKNTLFTFEDLLIESFEIRPSSSSSSCSAPRMIEIAALRFPGFKDWHRQPNLPTLKISDVSIRNVFVDLSSCVSSSSSSLQQPSHFKLSGVTLFGLSDVPLQELDSRDIRIENVTVITPGSVSITGFHVLKSINSTQRTMWITDVLIENIELVSSSSSISSGIHSPKFQVENVAFEGAVYQVGVRLEGIEMYNIQMHSGSRSSSSSFDVQLTLVRFAELISVRSQLRFYARDFFLQNCSIIKRHSSSSSWSPTSTTMRLLHNGQSSISNDGANVSFWNFSGLSFVSTFTARNISIDVEEHESNNERFADKIDFQVFHIEAPVSFNQQEPDRVMDLFISRFTCEQLSIIIKLSTSAVVQSSSSSSMPTSISMLSLTDFLPVLPDRGDTTNRYLSTILTVYSCRMSVSIEDHSNSGQQFDVSFVKYKRRNQVNTSGSNRLIFIEVSHFEVISTKSPSSIPASFVSFDVSSPSLLPLEKMDWDFSRNTFGSHFSSSAASASPHHRPSSFLQFSSSSSTPQLQSSFFSPTLSFSFRNTQIDLFKNQQRSLEDFSIVSFPTVAAATTDSIMMNLNNSAWEFNDCDLKYFYLLEFPQKYLATSRNITFDCSFTQSISSSRNSKTLSASSSVSTSSSQSLTHELSSSIELTSTENTPSSSHSGVETPSHLDTPTKTHLLSKSTSISSSRSTSPKMKKPNVGLDADILAATIATSQGVTAVASVLGDSPVIAMQVARSLSVLQLLGCPAFTEDGTRWRDQDPGFSWTLLPTLGLGETEASEIPKYYRLAGVAFFGLVIVGMLGGSLLISKPVQTSSSSSSSTATETKKGGLLLIQFFAIFSFPFMGQWFSAAGVMAGSVASRTDRNSNDFEQFVILDYCLATLPFLIATGFLLWGWRVLRSGLTAKKKVFIPLVKNMESTTTDHNHNNNNADDDEDDEEHELDAYHITQQTLQQQPRQKRQKEIKVKQKIVQNVQPYHLSESFVEKIDEVNIFSNNNNSNNDEEIEEGETSPPPRQPSALSFKALSLLRSPIGRFCLIGSYCWTQHSNDQERMWANNKIKRFIQEDKNNTRSRQLIMALKKSYGDEHNDNSNNTRITAEENQQQLLDLLENTDSREITLLDSMPRIFDKLRGPFRSSTTTTTTMNENNNNNDNSTMLFASPSPRRGNNNNNHFPITMMMMTPSNHQQSNSSGSPPQQRRQKHNNNRTATNHEILDGFFSQNFLRNEQQNDNNNNIIVNDDDEDFEVMRKRRREKLRRQKQKNRSENWRTLLCPYYFFFCATSAIICCFLEGLSKGMDNEPSVCRIAIGLNMIISLAMLFLSVQLLPVLVPLHNALLVTVEISGAVVAICVFSLTETYSDEFPPWISNFVMTVQLIGVTVASLVGFLLILSKVFKFTLLKIANARVVPAESYWKRKFASAEGEFNQEEMDQFFGTQEDEEEELLRQEQLTDPLLMDLHRNQLREQEKNKKKQNDKEKNKGNNNNNSSSNEEENNVDDDHHNNSSRNHLSMSPSRASDIIITNDDNNKPKKKIVRKRKLIVKHLRKEETHHHQEDAAEDVVI